MQLKTIFQTALFCFSEIVMIMINGNRTSCRPIPSVIILMINKSDSRFAVVPFCYSLVWLQIELDSNQSYYHYLWLYMFTCDSFKQRALIEISCFNCWVTLKLQFATLHVKATDSMLSNEKSSVAETRLIFHLWHFIIYIFFKQLF